MAASSSSSYHPVRSFLQGLGKPALVTMILEHADEAFLAHLELQAARCAPKGPDLARMRNHLEGVLDGMRGWDYAETADHAEKLEQFAKMLEGLIADGHPGPALDLAAEALEGVENHYGEVDDSSGYVGSAAHVLRKVHLLACCQAGVDPCALAQWLFRMEMGNAYGLFDDLLCDYKPILGEVGLTRYRQLAEEVWDRIPPLGPEQEESNGADRWRITSVMKALAGGDLERHLDVLLRDLSTPYHFLEVAEHCLASGWPGRAVEWAEKGLAAFKEPDPRLNSFLADRYLEAGRIGEAVDLRWANFLEHPGLETYLALLGAAGKGAGTAVQRERALSLLRERFSKANQGGNRWSRPDLDLLVRIHLEEKAPLEALAAAREGGCQHGTWMALADRLEKGHPEEALRILDEQLDSIIAPMGEDAYRRAASTLVRIQALASRIGKPSAFATTMAHVMTTHGRKRNLVSRIKKTGLI